MVMKMIVSEGTKSDESSKAASKGFILGACGKPKMSIFSSLMPFVVKAQPETLPAWEPEHEREKKHPRWEQQW